MDDRDTSIALLRERVSQLEAALNIVAAMRGRFDTSYRNHADAYAAFIKGKDEGWEDIRAALSPKQEEG